MAHEFARKEIKGGVPATKLASGIGSGDSTMTILSGTGWPTGSPGPFEVVISRGLASEEHLLCSARSGTTITIEDRGYAGTSAQSHASAATVEHAVLAPTIDQANRLANLMTAVGQLVGHNGTNPVAISAPSGDGQFLVSDSDETAGLTFVPIPDVVRDANAPNVATTVYKLWADTTLGIIRSSDGATWDIAKTCLVFANAGARTSALGSTPPNGLFSGIGDRLYVSLGGVWLQVGNKVVVASSQPDPASYLAGDTWAKPVT